MPKEGKKKGIKIGAVLVVLFMLIYIPSLVHWIYGKEITTDIIRSGSIEASYNVEGYIIRDEEIIKSPFEGNYIPDVTEGEKLATNYPIATVLGSTSIDALEELKKLDLRILEIKKEKSKNLGLFSQDLIKLDNEISEKVKLLASSSNAEDMEKFGEIRNEIDGIIGKKAEILGGLGKNDSFLNSLINERNALDRGIKSGTKQIISKSPGIISFYIDGLEARLNPGSMENITPDILESYSKMDFTQKTDIRNVEVNRPFAKVIKGIDYYFAAVLDKGLADTFDLGKNLSIRINDIGRKISASVYYKSKDTGGKSVVIFKTDEALSETTLLRRANINLIKNSYEGLKVSYKSLIDVSSDEKKAKIVLVKANYASIREVEIVGRNGEFAVIKGADQDFDKRVGLYDTYVINPRNIVEGQMIAN